MEVATAAPSGNADPAPPPPPPPSGCPDPDPATPWPCTGSMFGAGWGDWGQWLIYNNDEVIAPVIDNGALVLTAITDTPSSFVELTSPEFAADGSVTTNLAITITGGGSVNLGVSSNNQWIYSTRECADITLQIPAGSAFYVAVRAGSGQTTVRLLNTTGTEHFNC